MQFAAVVRSGQVEAIVPPVVNAVSSVRPDLTDDTMLWEAARLLCLFV
jgi:hypothetical protein